MLFGVVGIDVYQDAVGALSLREAIETTFQIGDYAIGTFNDLSVALIHNNRCYYVFHSNSRNEKGNVDYLGAAVILEFHSLEAVTEYLQNMYQNSHFNFSPVTNVNEQGRNTNTIPRSNL